jgi:hypothetical protein
VLLTARRGFLDTTFSNLSSTSSNILNKPVEDNPKVLNIYQHSNEDFNELNVDTKECDDIHKLNISTYEHDELNELNIDTYKYDDFNILDIDTFESDDLGELNVNEYLFGNSTDILLNRM